MIVSLKKITDNQQTSDNYIYYDNLSLDLKSKITIDVIIDNFNFKKILLVVDKKSKEFISIKIEEMLEDYYCFKGLSSIKTDRYYINDNDNIRNLESNQDFEKYIKDGICLHCFISTSEMWIKVNSILTSSLKDISIQFQIKIKRNIQIKQMKLLLLKVILSESINSLNSSPLIDMTYFINKSLLIVEKSSTEFFQNEINEKHEKNNEINEEMFNKLLVKEVFDYTSEISIKVELLSFEYLIFQKFQQLLSNLFVNNNINDINHKFKNRMNDVELFKIKTISFNEFICKRMYKDIFEYIQSVITQFLHMRSSLLLTNNDVGLYLFENNFKMEADYYEYERESTYDNNKSKQVSKYNQYNQYESYDYSRYFDRINKFEEFNISRILCISQKINNELNTSFNNINKENFNNENQNEVEEEDEEDEHYNKKEKDKKDLFFSHKHNECLKDALLDNNELSNRMYLGQSYKSDKKFKTRSIIKGKTEKHDQHTFHNSLIEKNIVYEDNLFDFDSSSSLKDKDKSNNQSSKKKTVRTKNKTSTLNLKSTAFPNEKNTLNSDIIEFIQNNIIIDNILFDSWLYRIDCNLNDYEYPEVREKEMIIDKTNNINYFYQPPEENLRMYNIYIFSFVFVLITANIVMWILVFLKDILN